MPWIGVPFVGSGWDPSLLGSASFWQQFIDQIEGRYGVLRDLSVAPFAEGPTDGVSAAISSTYGYGSNAAIRMELLREIPTYAAGWFGRVPSVGDSAPSYATGPQTLVDEINRILTEAGCPTMGPTIQAERDPGSSSVLGIPWTRKYGPAGSPSTAYGRPQPGDIIGPWFFNEWWAAIQACASLRLTAQQASILGGWQAYVGSTTGYPAQPTAADALATAVSDYADDPSFDATNNGKEGRWQVIQEPSSGVFTSGLLGSSIPRQFTPDFSIPELSLPFKVAHVAARPTFVSPTMAFETYGDFSTGENEAAFVDTHAAWDGPDGQIITTSHVDPTSPPSTPQTPTGTLSGYLLSPILYAPFNIPLPL